MILRLVVGAFVSVACALTVQAEPVYKVVGRDGRVTYTNETPAPNAGAVSTIDVDRGIVIPAPVRSSRAAVDQSTEQRLREQLVREQIETERARQQAFSAEASRRRAEADRLTAAKAACERDGWTDCDDAHVLVDRGWLVGPVVRRHRPRPVAPVMPVPQDSRPVHSFKPVSMVPPTGIEPVSGA